MTPIRHRALVFNTWLFVGNAADDMLVTGDTFGFCRLMCLYVKRRNVKPDSKRRSLPDSALFHADNRTERKTISPFSLIGILKKSKYMKNPISQRGKARAQMPHGKGKKKRK